MTTGIILVSQTAYNPYVALARDILKRYYIPCHEINIKAIPAVCLAHWPEEIQPSTLFIARREPGRAATVEALLAAVDAASMLRRPVNRQLEDWLYEHGFLKRPCRR